MIPLHSRNDWEREVLQAEMQRAGFVAWYRNPARATQDSLGIAYADNGPIKMVRPDFLWAGMVFRT